MDTKALRQKILDLAIHGKLVPQDLNDEPASVLLQRIREEKERLIKEGKIKREKKSAKTSDTAHYENVPFEVPETWEWCRLEDICSKFSTGPFGSMVHKSDYVAVDGIPMINPANITDGGISTEKVMLVSKNKAAELERYKLCVEDIILARRGDLSKCAIIKKEQVDFICGTGSFYLHLILMHPSYFKLFYNTSYVKSILETECVGATMSNLNQSVLGHLAIPLPPLEEQHRIVSEIERWFSLIDIIESGKTSLQTAVKQAKSKILDLAIHGKLVPQDPSDEPASELLRNINPKAEITSDNAHYGNVPQGWCLTKVGNVAEYTNGRAFKPEEWKTEGLPIIRIQNLNDAQAYYNRSNEKYESKYLIKNGDLLFAWAASLGTYIWSGGNAWLNQHIFKVEPFPFIDKTFLFYVFHAMIADFYRNSHGSGMVHITKKQFEEIALMLPPLAEQHRIVAQIEQLFTQLDHIEAEL